MVCPGHATICSAPVIPVCIVKSQGSGREQLLVGFDVWVSGNVLVSYLLKVVLLPAKAGSHFFMLKVCLLHGLSTC